MSRPRLIGLLLALITLLVYLPAAYHGFSIFDDDDYVTENHIIQNGLTWAGVKWAFTTWHASNWHPLTWLSHMLDCELFGLNAGAHHSVNLLLHAANAVLLFGLLLRLTNVLRPSAFVAALFAWHPVHVESVAWISERKDVLSTFFALLALLTYTRYAQRRSKVEPSQPRSAAPRSRESMTKSSVPALDLRPSTFDYALTLFFFALGLMAKPMLMTLPFVMLLLDYWPLKRFPPFWRLWYSKSGRFLCWWQFRASSHFWRNTMAAWSSRWKQSRCTIVWAMCLWLIRVTCLKCSGRCIWPFSIRCPKPSLLLAVVAAVAVLLAISAAAWLGRKSGPYGLVGWLWFLGTLVPVIGLVQVGHAAMADRYTYFPSIGVFIALTFAVRDWANRLQFSPTVITTAVVLILGGCVVLTENQLRCWRDDESLFSHAIGVTKDNEPAHLCLGQVYEMEGRKADALSEYRISLKLNPYRVKTYSNLAHLLADSGQTNEAFAQLREALRLYPEDALSHDSLANLLADSGHTNEALAEFREAVRINPKDAALHDNLGAMLVELGRFDEAMEQYAAAARLDPADWRAPYLDGQSAA